MKIDYSSPYVRLYEALRKGTGIRLSAADVHELVIRDDAIGTAVSGAVCDSDTDRGPPHKENGRYLTIRELRKRVASENAG
jgi:hypothetical protein